MALLILILFLIRHTHFPNCSLFHAHTYYRYISFFPEKTEIQFLPLPTNTHSCVLTFTLYRHSSFIMHMQGFHTAFMYTQSLKHTTVFTKLPSSVHVRMHKTPTNATSLLHHTLTVQDSVHLDTVHGPRHCES